VLVLSILLALASVPLFVASDFFDWKAAVHRHDPESAYVLYSWALLFIAVFCVYAAARFHVRAFIVLLVISLIASFFAANLIGNRIKEKS
jgi:hypothetical protein